MGRKSALSPEQWAEIDRRILIEGESVYKLAKEFGVNESSIRRKIKPNKTDKAESVEKPHPELREIAVRKAVSDEESRRVAQQIAKLPIATQAVVNELANRLSSISSHLAGAAEYGAATSHRLNGIAHAKVQEIDDSAPLTAESLEALKGVAVLTKIANESAHIGLNLLAANKEAMKEMAQPKRDQPQRITVEVIDASQPDAEA